MILKNKNILYADDTTLYGKVASPSDHINVANFLFFFFFCSFLPVWDSIFFSCPHSFPLVEMGWELVVSCAGYVK